MDIKIKPEILFIILSIIFGMGFLLINPPFQVVDEPTHYYKSVDLSKGQIYFGKSTSFIHLYSPIPYIVPSFSIFIGKLFNFSNSVIFYLGRISNLIFFICITYLAIRLTPILKWVFLLLGLMPMSLYEAASFSSDGFNIAISFLLIALIFKFAFDDKKININQNDIIIILFIGILLALSKQVYILLLVLFFLIPSNKFENRRKMFINFFSIFLSCLLIVIGWNFLVKGIYVPISTQVSLQGQMLFILSHPITFLTVPLNTILKNFLYYLITFVGTFGWTDTGLVSKLVTPLPNILVYAYIIVLIFASLLDNAKINVNINQKFISLITFLLIFTSIFTLEYLLWTVVGNNKIDGVYGRYFIPIAPLFFLMLYNNQTKQNIRGKKLAIIIFVVIILSISTFMIFERFYIH
jgi:uncharacterized membrane protein